MSSANNAKDIARKLSASGTESQVGDYWKAQYEELQKEQKNQEVDKRVLEVKNSRLEEKCARLEA